MSLKDNQNRKSLMIRVSAELKQKLDDQKKQTGETLNAMVERAIANLLDAQQKSSRRAAEQKHLARQLDEIATDLRKIITKIKNLTPKSVSDGQQETTVVVIRHKQPWNHHPQKERIFQVVRDMHRVGANVTMIASALRLEGLQTINKDGEWKAADVEQIVAAIKKEPDYFPPLYSVPE
ncbi:MAG: hypothetical protein R3274_06850 [Desulfobacterales bacterium]|nr:hypothetical protein [Desulfobacterales bacterium]